ncbi:MAG: septum formation initiator family protein [Clostridiales bacterium]|nr:septum formation initiator family protein [Clostridiales bacterium]
MGLKKVVRKKRPKRLLGIIILLVCTIGICTFFYVEKLKLQKKYDNLLEEKKRLEILIAEEEKRSKEVEDYKAYVQTKSYIEKVARDVLGLVYKNEVIFKVEGDGK